MSTLKTREVGDVTIFDLNEKLTIGDSASEFNNKIDQSIRDGKANIILNMAEVRSIDSTGCGELISAYTHIRDKGGKLKLLKLQPRIKEHLKILKLLTIFELFDTEEEAVKSLTKSVL